MLDLISIRNFNRLLCVKPYTVIILLSMLTFVFLSCENNLDLTVPAFEEKLTVESYLYQDDQVIVAMISKSWSPFVKKYWYDTLRRVNGAEVTLYSNGISFQLVRDTGKYFPNRWYGSSICSYYVCENHSILSENARINVKYNGKEYSASSSFPEKPKIVSATSEIRKNEGDVLVTIKIGPQQEKKSFYRTKIKIEFEYSLHSNYVYHESQETSEYFFIENLSEPKLIEYKNPIHTWSNIKFNKTYITLEHITEEYYNFLETCDIQRRKDNSALGTEGTEVPSSFQDCYGIFTCISRDTVCVNLK